MLGDLVALPQLVQAVLALLQEVGLLLDLGLVEAVDDGVLALGDEDLPDLARVLEADLADGHAAVLLQVRPGRVDDRHVVLLVALDRVGLGQLRQVREQVLRDRVPRLALAQPQVDVRARQLVHVKLEREKRCTVFPTDMRTFFLNHPRTRVSAGTEVIP